MGSVLHVRQLFTGYTAPKEQQGKRLDCEELFACLHMRDFNSASMGQAVQFGAGRTWMIVVTIHICLI